MFSRSPWRGTLLNESSGCSNPGQGLYCLRTPYLTILLLSIYRGRVRGYDTSHTTMGCQKFTKETKKVDRKCLFMAEVASFRVVPGRRTNYSSRRPGKATRLFLRLGS